MLGILFIYWIGKYFYQLAEKFNQNKWLYAILGIVVFYAAQLFFGILLGVGDAIFDLGINFEENLGLDLLGIPIGALACYLFYKNQQQPRFYYVQMQEDLQNPGTSDQKSFVYQIPAIEKTKYFVVAESEKTAQVYPEKASISPIIIPD